MASTRLYIYTNIPSPYNHHFWDAVCQEFPGSAIIFTEPMHKDRVWKDEASKHNYHCYYFMQDVHLPRIGGISRGLIPWLFSRGRGALHLLWSCGRGNNYLIRYLAKPLGGKLVHCNDGGFVDTLTQGAIQSYRRRFLGAVSAAYTPGRIGRDYFRTLGYRDEQIFNSYFSHDVIHFTSERVHHAPEYRRKIRRELGIPENHFVILNISRLLDWKRLEDLHKALQLLQYRSVRDMHTVLIGNGEHIAPVTAIQRECKTIGFHWIKGVPYQDMPKYYAMSDVLVFPSEGDIWGLVVNEALSMGKPVICTEQIGAAELMRDGENGYVVPVRAPAEIADRILRLYDDRNLLEQMSRTSLDITERWNTNLAIESLKDLVRYVTARA
jgi:glycosyltransferase involved in cell wall biosynthesis